MKKMRFSLVFAAMAAIAVLSCVKEQDMSVADGDQMTFSVVAEQTADPAADSDAKSVIVMGMHYPETPAERLGEMTLNGSVATEEFGIHQRFVTIGMN